MSDIATVLDGVPELTDLQDRARVYAGRAMGEGTKRSYGSALLQYEAFCAGVGADPLEEAEDVLGLYLTQMADAGKAIATLQLHASAVRKAWRLTNTKPNAGNVMKGIIRTYGSRPQRQAAPVGPGLLRQLLAACDPDRTIGKRDRAMLLVGFGAALRRSELVALTIGDITRVEGRGLIVLVRRSKTDQEGRGQEIALHAAEADPTFCPLRALDAWLACRPGAGPAAPLFCGVTKGEGITGEALLGRTVARRIKALVEAAGGDPTRFSGHSLRRGLASTAAENAESLTDLMRQTRHKSVDVAMGYIEYADLWRNNVTRKVFR